MGYGKRVMMAVLLLPVLFFGFQVQAGGVPLELDSTKPVSLTIYNQDLALICQEGTVVLPGGRSEIYLDGITRRPDVASVLLQVADGPGWRLLEQRFEYDLPNRQRLLTEYLGEEIILEKEEDGRKQRHRVRLLASEGSQIIVADGDEILIDPAGRIILPHTQHLVVRPTLRWLVESDEDGRRRVKLSYLSRGLSWKADYVGVLEEDQLLLRGWVTINNQSGSDFDDVRLRLVAGEVNTVPEVPVMRTMGRGMAEDKAAGLEVEARPLFEYHRYDLGRSVRLRDSESVQVTLFPQRSVKAGKHFVVQAWQSNDVQVYLRFANQESNGACMALPAGRVRVYVQDEDGNVEFAGEDGIGHTPVDGELELRLGKAFDVKAEKKMVKQEVKWNKDRKEVYQVVVRNHKSEDVDVEVVDKFWGNWELLDASDHEMERPDANTIQFTVHVPAGEEEAVSYSILRIN